VLDFRRSNAPRPGLTGRQQKLALVVVILVGILFGVSQDWTGWARRMGAPSDPSAEQRGAPIDTRAPTRTTDGEIPGTFFSPLEEPSSDEPAPPSRYFPGVMPSYLASVRDDTVFLHSEKDAWFNLLNILDKTELKKLKEASTGRVTFVQLYRQSADYRGELVTLRGVMRWAHRVTAPKNDYGIKHYYQAWITPADSPDNVEVVYCLRLPPKFPTGMNLSVPVEVTGFYFKRWIYRAKDTLRTTPVVLAQTVERQERLEFARTSDESFGMVLAVVAGTALGGILLAVLLVRQTARPRRKKADVEGSKMSGPTA